MCVSKKVSYLFTKTQLLLPSLEYWIQADLEELLSVKKDPSDQAKNDQDGVRVDATSSSHPQ